MCSPPQEIIETFAFVKWLLVKSESASARKIEAKPIWPRGALIWLIHEKESSHREGPEESPPLAGIFCHSHNSEGAKSLGEMVASCWPMANNNKKVTHVEN